MIARPAQTMRDSGAAPPPIARQTREPSSLERTLEKMRNTWNPPPTFAHLEKITEKSVALAPEIARALERMQQAWRPPPNFLESVKRIEESWRSVLTPQTMQTLATINDAMASAVVGLEPYVEQLIGLSSELEPLARSMPETEDEWREAREKLSKDAQTAGVPEAALNEATNDLEQSLAVLRTENKDLLVALSLFLQRRVARDPAMKVILAYLLFYAGFPEYAFLVLVSFEAVATSSPPESSSTSEDE